VRRHHVEPTPQQPDSTPTVDKKAAKPGRVIAAGLVAAVAAGGLITYNTSTYQLPPAPKADKAVAALIPAGAYNVDGGGQFTGPKPLQPGVKQTSGNARWSGYVDFAKDGCSQDAALHYQFNNNEGRTRDLTEHYLQNPTTPTLGRHEGRGFDGKTVNTPWSPLSIPTFERAADPSAADPGVIFARMTFPTVGLDTATLKTPNRGVCFLAEAPYLYQVADGPDARVTKTLNGQKVTVTKLVPSRARFGWSDYQSAAAYLHFADVLGLRGHSRDSYMSKGLMEAPLTLLYSKDLEVVTASNGDQHWIWSWKRSKAKTGVLTLTPTQAREVKSVPHEDVDTFIKAHRDFYLNN